MAQRWPLLISYHPSPPPPHSPSLSSYHIIFPPSLTSSSFPPHIISPSCHLPHPHTLSSPPPLIIILITPSLSPNPHSRPVTYNATIGCDSSLIATLCFHYSHFMTWLVRPAAVCARCEDRQRRTKTIVYRWENSVMDVLSSVFIITIVTIIAYCWEGSYSNSARSIVYVWCMFMHIYALFVMILFFAILYACNVPYRTLQRGTSALWWEICTVRYCTADCSAILQVGNA